MVDAAQGVEAQTLANTYLAVDTGLELIPALNKIDLPGAEPDAWRGRSTSCSAGPGGRAPHLGEDRGGREEMLEAVIAQCHRPRAIPTPRRAR